MKRKFLVVGIAGTLVVTLVAVVLTTSAPSRDYAGKLESLRDEAEKLGLPTTLEDVPLSGTVDDAANAAALIRQAAEEQDDQAAISLLIEAGRKSACRFEWEGVEDFDKEFEALRLDRGIDLLMEAAQKEFATGKDVEARRKVHAALVVARHVSSFPAIECLAKSLLLERRTYERLAKLMIDQPDHKALMPVVQSELFSPRDRRQLALALRRFTALGHHIATNRELDGDQKLSWLWGAGEFPADPWGRAAVEARHLEGTIELFKDLDSATTWPAAFRTVRDQVAEWQKDTRKTSYSLREASRDLATAPRLAAENEAARRILFVTAAVFRYRQQYGRFPTESPVRGATATDPFTNKPMVYSHEGHGFWIYSAGPDEMPVGAGPQQGLQVGDEIAFKYSGPPLP